MARQIGLNNHSLFEEADMEGEIDFEFFESGMNGMSVTDKKSEEAMSQGNEKPGVPDTLKNHKCSTFCSEQNDILSEQNGICSEQNEAAGCSGDCKMDRDVKLTDSESEDELEENGHSLDVSVSEFDSDDLDSISQNDSLEEGSDAEITDVSPLPSNYQSPIPSSPKLLRLKAQSQKASMKSVNKRKNGLSSQSKPADKELDLDQLLQAVLELEEEHRRSVSQANLVERLAVRRRKNMSFNNEDVWRIDRENQRLLKQIWEKQWNSKCVPQQPSTSSSTNRPSSSAINRQREQKRVEAENLVLLKRIQSAKPSRDLSRIHHHHHHHHASKDYPHLSVSFRQHTAPLHRSGSALSRSSSASFQLQPRAPKSSGGQQRGNKAPTSQGAAKAPTSKLQGKLGGETNGTTRTKGIS